MSIIADLPWLLPAITGGVGILYAMIRYPKVWLALFLLVLPYFLMDTGEGLSVTEVVLGGLFTGSIALWMIWRLAVDPRPLVKGWTDFLLLFFILASFANIIVARFNHVELSGWAVDWSYFMLMLYYFPFREQFGKDTTTFRQFIALAGVSSFLMALYSAWTFKQKMAENMVYAYQIQASRSATLGPLFLLAICVGLVLIFHVKWRPKLMTFLVVVINIAALVLTFTRTLWVLVFACSFLAMLFLRWQQNSKIIIGSVALLAVSITTFYAVNPKVAGVALLFIQKRFTSSTQLKGGDFSFETRLIEVSNAWRKVKQAVYVPHLQHAARMRRPLLGPLRSVCLRLFLRCTSTSSWRGSSISATEMLCSRSSSLLLHCRKKRSDEHKKHLRHYSNESATKRWSLWFRTTPTHLPDPCSGHQCGLCRTSCVAADHSG